MGRPQNHQSLRLLLILLVHIFTCESHPYYPSKPQAQVQPEHGHEQFWSDNKFFDSLTDFLTSSDSAQSGSSPVQSYGPVPSFTTKPRPPRVNNRPRTPQLPRFVQEQLSSFSEPRPRVKVNSKPTQVIIPQYERNPVSQPQQDYSKNVQVNGKWEQYQYPHSVPAPQSRPQVPSPDALPEGSDSASQLPQPFHQALYNHYDVPGLALAQEVLVFHHMAPTTGKSIIVSGQGQGQGSTEEMKPQRNRNRNKEQKKRVQEQKQKQKFTTTSTTTTFPATTRASTTTTEVPVTTTTTKFPTTPTTTTVRYPEPQFHQDEDDDGPFDDNENYDEYGNVSDESGRNKQNLVSSPSQIRPQSQKIQIQRPQTFPAFASGPNYAQSELKPQTQAPDNFYQNIFSFLKPKIQPQAQPQYQPQQNKVSNPPQSVPQTRFSIPKSPSASRLQPGVLIATVPPPPAPLKVSVPNPFLQTFQNLAQSSSLPTSESGSGASALVENGLEKPSLGGSINDLLEAGRKILYFPRGVVDVVDHAMSYAEQNPHFSKVMDSVADKLFGTTKALNSNLKGQFQGQLGQFTQGQIPSQSQLVSYQHQHQPQVQTQVQPTVPSLTQSLLTLLATARANQGQQISISNSNPTQLPPLSDSLLTLLG